MFGQIYDDWFGSKVPTLNVHDIHQMIQGVCLTPPQMSDHIVNLIGKVSRVFLPELTDFRGRQCGYFNFFLKNLLTGRHLEILGGEGVKKHPVYFRDQHQSPS